MKKINIHDSTYKKAEALMEKCDANIGRFRTFRNMAQLVEEAIMTYAPTRK